MAVAGVSHAGPGDARFVWQFPLAFDDAGLPDWKVTDFDSLRIDGNPPSGIDEVIGSDGSLTLLYGLGDPDAEGMTYEVLSPPAVLVFDNGQHLQSPQSGTVTQ